MTNIHLISAAEEVQELWIEHLQKVEYIPILLVTGVPDAEGGLHVTNQVAGYIPLPLLISALEQLLEQVKASQAEEASS